MALGVQRQPARLEWSEQTRISRPDKTSDCTPRQPPDIGNLGAISGGMGHKMRKNKGLGITVHAAMQMRVMGIARSPAPACTAPKKNPRSTGLRGVWLLNGAGLFRALAKDDIRL